jgi:hypothetical protein
MGLLINMLLLGSSMLSRNGVWFCYRMLLGICRLMNRRRCTVMWLYCMTDARTDHSSCGWLTMIHRSILSPVNTGLVLMIRLGSGSIYMPFPHRSLFLGTRPGIDSMRTTIITDPVTGYCIIMHYDCIVDIYIMNNCAIYIDDGRIIPERISLPSAAAETGAIITVTIVYAAIKTDMRSPVTMMKTIITTGISPISRRP